jgi:hypothetical protein
VGGVVVALQTARGEGGQAGGAAAVHGGGGGGGGSMSCDRRSSLCGRRFSNPKSSFGLMYLTCPVPQSKSCILGRRATRCGRGLVKGLFDDVPR